MIRKLQPVRAPVCGVFAATLATPDMPFIAVKGLAHEELNMMGRWKGRMRLSTLKALLTQLGVAFSNVDAGEGALRVVAERLCPTKHYILFVTGHFLTLHDGKCYDQQNVDGASMANYWAAGKYVKAVIEVDRSKPAKTYAEMFPDE